MTVFVFLSTLLGTMAIGVPVAFALVFCGMALMLFMGATDPQIVAAKMVARADSFTLLAVPFFLLAGEAMNAGGLSRRFVNFAVVGVGHMRGGLGTVTIFAAIIMASLSGSPSADTAALASILIPMMRDAGYKVPRAAGLMAAGGIIAPVIPPSIAFIIFGVAANVSITGLFIAGIVPGLMMALALLAAWLYVSRDEQSTTGLACEATCRAQSRLGLIYARHCYWRYSIRNIYTHGGRYRSCRIRAICGYIYLS